MTTLRSVYIKMEKKAVAALMFSLGNEGDAEVIGKWTYENGLLVPAIYSLRTRSKNISDT